ncbi:hypothetical protein, partial [Roseiarcus sp.]|uniref:hypothetical protein n=1 Tax=Roseiarcus sp. TaxID=1969460 RepID=UPI003F956A21
MVDAEVYAVRLQADRSPPAAAEGPVRRVARPVVGSRLRSVRSQGFYKNKKSSIVILNFLDRLLALPN